MKPLLHRTATRRPFIFGVPITTTLLLLAALAVSAQTAPFTATGWVNGVLAPGIMCTNGSGQLLIRGNVHTARVQGTDPRFTGQVLIISQGGNNADGTFSMQGTSYLQVGTWDAAGTNFTPTAGMWEMDWHAVMQTNYSMQLSQTGYGSGGTIDGLRLEETATRGPAAGPIDFTVPYLHTGTIKPPPVSTSQVLDDFSGPPTGWTYWGPQQYSFTRSNGQLVVRGYWPGTTTRSIFDNYTFGNPPVSWTVANGQSVESRVDLADLNASATAAILGMGNVSAYYTIHRGHDFMWVFKWSSRLGQTITTFIYEQTHIPDTNVVLSLGLTRDNANVVVTARVLDKTNPGRILYQGSFVDTPNADPALTAEELHSLSGMSQPSVPDLPGTPVTTGGTFIGVWQDNYDGKQPAAIAIFDNLELRKQEVPQLDIEQAVRLSWPAPAGVNYAVEGAPSVLGPWLPVRDLSLPGLQQITVPATEAVQFFRLLQVP